MQKLSPENFMIPTKEGVEYFDATKAIEAMLTEIQRLDEMAKTQLAINSKLLLIAKDLQARLNKLEGKKSTIILPD